MASDWFSIFHACIQFFEKNQGMEIYHWVLGASAFFLMIRILIFWTIPGLKKIDDQNFSFQVLVKVVKVAGYFAFYAFDCCLPLDYQFSRKVCFSIHG
jgi:hypothetical protein